MSKVLIAVFILLCTWPSAGIGDSKQNTNNEAQTAAAQNGQNAAAGKGQTSATQNGPQEQKNQDQKAADQQRGSQSATSDPNQLTSQMMMMMMFKNQLDAINTNNQQTICKSINEEFNKRRDEIMAVCKDSGNMLDLDQCRNFAQKCSTALNQLGEINITSDGMAALSNDQLENMRGECPPFVDALAKKADSVVKDSKKTIADLNKELNEAQKGVVEAAKNLEQQSINQIKELQQLNDEEEQTRVALQRNLDDINSKGQEETAKLQIQFSQLRMQLNELETKQHEAIAKYNEALGKINTECRERAEKQVRDFLNQSSNVGSFNALIHNKSRAKALESQVISYECNRPAIIEARANAGRILDVTLNGLQKNIATIKQQIDQEPVILQQTFERFSNLRQSAIRNAQAKLLQLTGRKQSAMAQLASSGKNQYMSLQIAQQRAQQIQERLQMATTESVVAKSIIQSGVVATVSSNDKLDPQKIAGLSNSFQELGDAYCAAEKTLKDLKTQGKVSGIGCTITPPVLVTECNEDPKNGWQKATLKDVK